MSIPFKSSPVEFNQHLLFPTNIFDLLPKDHECFLYADLFQQIDTSSLESLYSVKGQHAYHPKLIVAILIYAYSQGVFSSRKIEKRCKEDLSFMLATNLSRDILKFQRVAYNSLPSFPWQRNLIHVLN